VLAPEFGPVTRGDTEGDLVARGDSDGEKLGVNAGDVKVDSWLIGERGRDDMDVAWLVLDEPPSAIGAIVETELCGRFVIRGGG